MEGSEGNLTTNHAITPTAFPLADNEYADFSLLYLRGCRSSTRLLGGMMG